MSDVKFDVDTIYNKMNELENVFTNFSTQLTDINSYIQSVVNVGVDSAVFGNYGAKMLSIWDQNASTFGDFHANFTAWSEVVSTIAAKKQDFAVDTAALYRNNGGNLDGVKEARTYFANPTADNLNKLSDDAKKVVDSSIKVDTYNKITDKNIYGGVTLEYKDSKGNIITEYWDGNGRLAAKSINGKEFYDVLGNKVNSLPTNDDHKKNLDKIKENEQKELDANKEVIKDMVTKYPKVSTENVTVDIKNLDPDSAVGKAIEEYGLDLDDVVCATVKDNLYSVTTQETIGGKKVYVTHVIVNDPSQIGGAPANGKYGSGLEKASDAASRLGAEYVINGSHYLDGGYQDTRFSTNNIVIVDGKVVKGGYTGGNEMILFKDGTIGNYKDASAQDLVKKGAVYSFTCHSVPMIENGSIRRSYEEGRLYNRTSFGMVKPGEYYIVTDMEGGNRLSDTASWLKDKGCTNAYSMDQGGSVTLTHGNKVVNNPTDSTGERSVGDFIYVKA